MISLQFSSFSSKMGWRESRRVYGPVTRAESYVATRLALSVTCRSPSVCEKVEKPRLGPWTCRVFPKPLLVKHCAKGDRNGCPFGRSHVHAATNPAHPGLNVFQTGVWENSGDQDEKEEIKILLCYSLWKLHGEEFWKFVPRCLPIGVRFSWEHSLWEFTKQDFLMDDRSLLRSLAPSPLPAHACHIFHFLVSFRETRKVIRSRQQKRVDNGLYISRANVHCLLSRLISPTVCHLRRHFRHMILPKLHNLHEKDKFFFPFYR